MLFRSLVLTYFTAFFSVSFVNFEHVTAGWVLGLSSLEYLGPYDDLLCDDLGAFL